MNDKIMRFLCRIGFHKWTVYGDRLPKENRQAARCVHCNAIKERLIFP